ncbi:nuclear transport factor 2 family protein [Faunimonas sp. B44]|uniref:nuclear transport factor 2 family protein n=1 Tax=Faunimonas sp. B44 TaxID=3461493 RepID=UPI004044F0A8
MSEGSAEQAINELLRGYAAAFDDADAEAVAGFFAYPAVIWQLGDGHVFEDADEIEENADALIDVFDEAGIVVMIPQVRALNTSGNSAFVTVDWRQEAQDGEVVHAFRCHYLLILQDGTWRIATVVNEDTEGT